jgi:hypothetical protein
MVRRAKPEAAPERPKNTGFAHLRLRQTKRLIAHRYGLQLPVNKMGFRVIRFVLDHAANMGKIDPRRSMNEWCNALAPWLDPSSRRRLIELAISRAIYAPRYWSARRAGEWLKVTTAERVELRLDTIRAIDRTDAEYRKDRLSTNAARQQRHRERQRHAAKEREAVSPWIAAGISKATYYRRQKQQNETSLTGKPKPSHTPQSHAAE